MSTIAIRAGLLLTLAMCAVLAQGPPPRDRYKPRRPPPAGAAAIERFNDMTPNQRARALDRLPPDRRRDFENRVERYNRLSPEEKERLQDSYDRFRQLPPDRRDEARRVFGRFRQLPEERRTLIQSEVRTLRGLTPEARQDHVDSPAYMEKFSPEERRIIRDLGRAFAPREDPEPEEL